MSLAADRTAWCEAHLAQARPAADGWLTACCPLHDDRTPSLGVNPATGGATCRAGCEIHPGTLARLAELAGLPTPPGKPRKAAPGPKTLAGEWIYRTPEGEPYLRVSRYDTPRGKSYPQASYRGGAWVPVGMARTPLYQADRLAQAAPGDPVLIVEGERCADYAASWGLLATTAPEGAGKWHKVDPAYRALLQGLHVVILPDHDSAGRRHAADIVRDIRDLAASVRVLELPGLPAKGDLVDWIGAGGTRERLLELVQAAPTGAEWLATQEPPRPAPRPPGILLPSPSCYDLADTCDLAVAALAAANSGPDPALYLSGGRLTRIAAGQAEPLDRDGLADYLARVAPWQAAGKDGPYPIPPPMQVVRSVLVRRDWPPEVPRLQAVLRMPCMSADGTLVVTPGWHPGPGCYLDLPEELAGLEVPEDPTPEDIAAAVEALVAPMVDFPFVAKADRAQALAACIEPLGRDCIGGPTPLRLLRSPMRGTGKGLLEEVICLGPAAEQSWPGDEAEQGKRLLAVLRGSPAYIRLSNLHGRLASAHLESALTAWPEWEGRLLGATQQLTVPQRSTWLGSANQLELSEDMARRTIPIMLDARCEHPSIRSGWRIPDLRAYLVAHRRQRVAAALALWRAWHVAGRPLWQGQPPGSYEAWGRVMGGVMGVAGVAGWLEGWADTLAEQAPDDSAAVAHLVQAWWAAHGGARVTVADLLRSCCRGRDGALRELRARSVSPRAYQTAVGRLLAQHAGRTYAGRQIQRAGRARGLTEWRLVDLGGGGPTTRSYLTDGVTTLFGGPEGPEGPDTQVILREGNTCHARAHDTYEAGGEVLHVLHVPRMAPLQAPRGRTYASRDVHEVPPEREFAPCPGPCGGAQRVRVEPGKPAPLCGPCARGGARAGLPACGCGPEQACQRCAGGAL